MGAYKEVLSEDNGVVHTQGNDLDHLFTSNTYNIEQPFFQFLQEGYKISTPEGEEIFNAVRKRDFIKTIGARFGAFFGAMIVSSLTFWGLKFAFGVTSTDMQAMIIPGLVSAVLLVGGYLFLNKALTPKRVTTLYHGEEEDESKIIFQIMPTSGFFYFNKEFHLLANGQSKLTFKRPFTNSLFRIKWEVYDESDKLLFVALEDSWFMSILRRYLNLAKLIPMHFIFQGSDQQTFCEFKRKYSIRDKYSIHSNSTEFKPWMTLATCILLDTGEER